MNSTVVALIVGIVAGLCGALVGGMVSKGGSEGAGPSHVDQSAVHERLDRIEAKLDREGLRTASAHELRGRVAEGAGADELATLADALADRLEERMEGSVRKAVKETWEEMGGDALPPDVVPMPAKKEVTLAEASRELELSSAEEAELRRIHEESIEKFLTALADEETGIEGVKQDLLDAKEDPAKRAALIPKYLGRVMSKLGEVIVIGTEHDRKIVELIGKDKAARLESEFELTDIDPYDIEGVFEGFGD